METSSVRFEILGPVRARRGSDELSLGSGKQRAVLATLLVEANRPVPPARIVDTVWRDDPPANGTNVVQKYVAGLRQVLEPNRAPRSSGELLTLTDGGYVLSVGPGCLDSEVFGEHLRRARGLRVEGRLDAAVEELGMALRLWRAEPLAGLSGPVFEAARDRLVENRATALELWAEIGLELGNHGPLLPDLARMVDEFPLREGLRYLQMLALFRSGRQAEALAVYRDARRLLVDEFGIEPGERLRQLQDRILQGDPALLIPGPQQRPPLPASSPAPAPRAVRTVVAALISLVTVGFGSWAVIGYFAINLRNRLLFLIAAGYLAVPVGVVIAVSNAPDDSIRLVVAGWVMLALGCCGAVHATWLSLRSPGAEPPAPMPVEQGPAGIRWRLWAAGLFAAAIPLASLGWATWAIVFYFGIRRGSRRLLLLAAGYLGCTVGFFTTMDITEPYNPARELLTTIMFIVPWLGGAAHCVALALRDPESRRGGGRAGRERARELAARHPAVARDLGIGRPDLPRRFDDGGLVDINDAPAHVLLELPGVTPKQAALIVADRQQRGRFASADDLVTRGLLPSPLPGKLRDRLIVIEQS